MRIGIEASEVRPLVAIAFGTAQCEVLLARQSTVLCGNDVVNLESPRMDGLRQLAIFATIGGAGADLILQCSGHGRLCRRRMLAKRYAGFGLEDGKEIAEEQIPVKFARFIG